MTDAWRFAVEAWGRPCVEAVCLELQDDDGQLPILLIWRLWTLAAGGGVSEPVVRAACALARGWEADILAPLRQVRGALKTKARDITKQGADAVRGHVLATELAAERALLESLEAMAGERDGPPMPALPALFALAGAWRPPAPETRLRRLVAALSAANP